MMLLIGSFAFGSQSTTQTTTTSMQATTPTTTKRAIYLPNGNLAIITKTFDPTNTTISYASTQTLGSFCTIDLQATEKNKKNRPNIGLILGFQKLADHYTEELLLESPKKLSETPPSSQRSFSSSATTYSPPSPCSLPSPTSPPSSSRHSKTTTRIFSEIPECIALPIATLVASSSQSSTQTATISPSASSQATSYVHSLNLKP
jgi:hypothetical protein